MILTVTVHSHCAPQNVTSLDGTVNVQPGESITAKFSEAQEAYIRACPGHFSIAEKPASDAPVVLVNKPVLAQQPRRRGRGRH